MLNLSDDLPAAALLDGARSDLRETLADGTTLWFEGLREAFETDPDSDVISAWNSSSAAPFQAVPVKPNTGNGRIAKVQGHAGLSCLAGVNCGLVAPHVTTNAGHCSFAVIYQPGSSAASLTLMTLNTGEHAGGDGRANYLFLSDDGKAFTIKDTHEAVRIETPVRSPADRPRMALVTISGDTLAFSENIDEPVIARGTDPAMKMPADLFIGCRSQRKGLQKTLGQSTILDVFFWPRNTLLLPRCPEDSALLLAIRRYFLWGY
ncbi:MAG: hypothetical protein Q4G26_00090 [Paracoccus sp. (in: a-proteobacteria)]|nr:hypothetical protein [Paracoccus sp. (in: a-proteobacteria)]